MVGRLAAVSMAACRQQQRVVSHAHGSSGRPAASPCLSLTEVLHHDGRKLGHLAELHSGG